MHFATFYYPIRGSLFIDQNFIIGTFTLNNAGLYEPKFG